MKNQPSVSLTKYTDQASQFGGVQPLVGFKYKKSTKESMEEIFLKKAQKPMEHSFISEPWLHTSVLDVPTHYTMDIMTQKNPVLRPMTHEEVETKLRTFRTLYVQIAQLEYENICSKFELINNETLFQIIFDWHYDLVQGAHEHIRYYGKNDWVHINPDIFGSITAYEKYANRLGVPHIFPLIRFVLWQCYYGTSGPHLNNYLFDQVSHHHQINLLRYFGVDATNEDNPLSVLNKITRSYTRTEPKTLEEYHTFRCQSAIARLSSDPKSMQRIREDLTKKEKVRSKL
jgi:hypothetical protein